MILAEKGADHERERLAGGVRSHPRRPARRHGRPLMERVLREVEAGSLFGYAAILAIDLPITALWIALCWVMLP